MVRIEISKKNIGIPTELLRFLTKEAAKRGIPCTSYILNVLHDHKNQLENVRPTH